MLSFRILATNAQLIGRAAQRGSLLFRSQPQLKYNLLLSVTHSSSFHTSKVNLRRASDVENEELHEDTIKTIRASGDYMLPHPLWKGEYVDGVKVTHANPSTFLDWLAMAIVKTIRFNFDWMSGYSWMRHTESIWLKRLVFLETVAGIPGSVAGTLRHLHSLRRLKRDHGWIHTLYEEAENERMHMLTFVKLYEPSFGMRALVFISQGMLFNFFWVSYLISPRFCHKFVGYLEEEAVKTYTHCLSEIDKGYLPWKKLPAPDIAIDYWKLPADATMRDVIAVVRADEAHHRDVNHTFAGKRADEPNTFPPGF